MTSEQMREVEKLAEGVDSKLIDLFPVGTPKSDYAEGLEIVIERLQSSLYCVQDEIATEGGAG